MFVPPRLSHMRPAVYRAKATGIRFRRHHDFAWIPVVKHATYPRYFQTVRTYTNLPQEKQSADREPEKSTPITRKTERWTKAETVRLKELLSQERQVWEIATSLGKASSLILRKLQSNRELSALWKPHKKGRFSSDETAFLIRLRRFGAQRQTIALYLGRDDESVRRKINREALRIFTNEQTDTFQGPQALTPELEDSITKGRLQDAFTDLLSCNMADYWRELLHQEQAGAWLSVIADNIPTQVKKLLASHEPPSIEQLEELSWIETDVPGVYGWLMRPTDQRHFSRECYLYVGSAGKPRFGLNGRKAQHLSTTEHNPRLVNLIRRNRLRRQGTFVTFLSMHTDSAKNYDALVTKHIVILAEAIFTALFGALPRIGHEPTLQGLRPWGVDTISWTGCCSHNPLTMDFLPPGALPEPETVQELRMRSKATPYWETDGRSLQAAMGHVTGGMTASRLKNERPSGSIGRDAFNETR